LTSFLIVTARPGECLNCKRAYLRNSYSGPEIGELHSQEKFDAKCSREGRIVVGVVWVHSILYKLSQCSLSYCSAGNQDQRKEADLGTW